jgi:hypothetical protein
LRRSSWAHQPDDHRDHLLLFIGGSFAILEKSGIIHAAIARIIARFGRRKYALMLVIAFLYGDGSFLGILRNWRSCPSPSPSPTRSAGMR